MDNERYKEVYYQLYCAECKFQNVKDNDEPCCECLDEPINLHSHKPVKFKEK